MGERRQLGLVLSLAVIVTAAFVMLAGMSATTTSAQVAITYTPTATVTPTGTITVTAAPTGTPTVTPIACGTPLNLVQDAIVYLKPGVYLRAAPTVNSAIMGYFEQSMTFRIQGGPVCAEGYYWWQVSAGAQLRGWVAEGRADTGYFIFDSGLLYNEVPVDCGSSAEFVIGETILLYKSLRVRAEPGLSALVLTVAPDGTEAIVLEGPVCMDSYNWWKVRVQVLNVVYDGWIAQGTKQSTVDWLESEAAPQEICAPALPLDIGEAAYVTATNNIPKRLHTAPGVDAPVLYDLIVNTPIIIVDGPFCKDGYNWWKVTVRSNIEATGWMAEGPRWIKTIE